MKKFFLTLLVAMMIAVTPVAGVFAQSTGSASTVTSAISSIGTATSSLQSLIGSNAFGTGASSLFGTGTAAGAISALTAAQSSLQTSVSTNNYATVAATGTTLQTVASSLRGILGAVSGNIGNSTALTTVVNTVANVGTTLTGVSSAAGAVQGTTGNSTDFVVTVTNITATSALVTMKISGAAARSASMNTALQNGSNLAAVTGVVGTLRNVETLLQGLIGSGAFGSGVSALVNNGAVTAALATIHSVENSLQTGAASGNFSSISGSINSIRGITSTLQGILSVVSSNTGNSAIFTTVINTLATVGTSLQNVSASAGTQPSLGGALKFNVAYGRTPGFLFDKTADCTINPSVPADLTGMKTCSSTISGLTVGKTYHYKFKGNIVVPNPPTGTFDTTSDAPHVDSLPVTQTATNLTAPFRFGGIPTKDTSFYLWVGNTNGTWIKRDKLLASVNASTSSTTKDFSALIDFASLNLQQGKQYSYVIADGTVDGSKILTPTAYFIVGNTVAGGAPCTDPKSCGDPVSISLSPFVITNTSATIKGTIFANFVDVPKGVLNLSTGTSVNSLGVPAQAFTGTIPMKGIAFSKTVSNLLPGTTYWYNLKEATTSTDFGNQSFVTTGTASSTSSTTASTSGTSSAQITVPGMTISFPASQQVLNGTSAQFHGIVSVSLPLAVKLSFLSAASGQPLGNEQPLITAQMTPAASASVVMNFNGLVQGQTYQFAIKNKVTNVISSPFSFTTPGGATNETAVFDGQRIGGNDGTASFTALPDTISDKGIVPRCGLTAGNGATPEEQKMCGYKDFLKLISNIIQYGLIIIGPIVAIMAIYSGAMIMWLGKDKDPTGEVMKALEGHKARLVRIVIGIGIMLLSFVIISTIIRELGVKPDYTLLDIVHL